MAETCATPFLVLAALAFVRAARAPRVWIAFGLCLGAGFLFSYAAIPVTVGFGVALLAVSRGDLRRRELWAGLIAFALVAGVGSRFAGRSIVPIRAGRATASRPFSVLLLANLPFYAFAAIGSRRPRSPRSLPRGRAPIRALPFAAGALARGRPRAADRARRSSGASSTTGRTSVSSCTPFRSSSAFWPKASSACATSRGEGAVGGRGGCRLPRPGSPLEPDPLSELRHRLPRPDSRALSRGGADVHAGAEGRPASRGSPGRASPRSLPRVLLAGTVRFHAASTFRAPSRIGPTRAWPC